MKTRIPREASKFPFAVVLFDTVRHGRVILSCRFNDMLYNGPAEQIREEYSNVFADPEFTVTGEKVLSVRER